MHHASHARQAATRPAKVGPQRPGRAPWRSGGFTLTELLVVIAIIAMLAALVTVAVMRAMDTAKQTRIKVEVDQLDSAFKAYKEKYGSYPPFRIQLTPTPRRALQQHVSRAFPRYDITKLDDDLKAAGVDVINIRPDQALVFWLRGFGPDPAHPFVTINDEQIVNGMVPNPGVKVPRTQFFEFDPTRLAWSDMLSTAQRTTGNGYGPVLPSYFPAGTRMTINPDNSGAGPVNSNSPYPKWEAGGAPYVYFDAAANAAISNPPQVGPPLKEAAPYYFNRNTGNEPFPGAGRAMPYWHDTNGNGKSAENMTAPLDFDSNGNPLEDWVNPDSFQIIAPGGDGKYGNELDTARMYPTDKNTWDTSADRADDDNVTNFCASARLADAKP